jgi:hypothetical protein
MKANKFLHNESGSMQMVNAGVLLVVLLVVLYIGINIIDNVNDSTALSSGDELYDAQQALINTTDAAYGMAGIMPIVMIAVAVLAGLLGILYLFRRD